MIGEIEVSHSFVPKFQTGDEMSKRAKFVLVTWIGPSVSVMKKAKMSTDKAVIKDVIQVSLGVFFSTLSFPPISLESV